MEDTKRRELAALGRKKLEEFRRRKIEESKEKDRQEKDVEPIEKKQEKDVEPIEKKQEKDVEPIEKKQGKDVEPIEKKQEKDVEPIEKKQETHPLPAVGANLESAFARLRPDNVVLLHGQPREAGDHIVAPHHEDLCSNATNVLNEDRDQKKVVEEVSQGHYHESKSNEDTSILSLVGIHTMQGDQDVDDTIDQNSFLHHKTSFDAREYLIPGNATECAEAEEQEYGTQEVDENCQISVLDRVSTDSDENRMREVDDQHNIRDFHMVEKRKNFEKLQDHIDTLTMEKMDLSLCLQQQTNIVQKLTRENEDMTKRLNDAATYQDKLKELSKQHEAHEMHMQKELTLLQRQMELKEKENRDLSSKVKVLGSELITLEEKLLREKNERMKQLSTSKRGELETQLFHEIETHKTDCGLLRSRVTELEEKLDKTERALQKSERELLEAVDIQKKLSDDLQNTLKQQKNSVSLPKSAIVSADPMESFALESTEKESTCSIPSEIRALLPVQTWVPGVEDLKDDMNSISERLYTLLNIAEERVSNPNPPQSVSENAL